MPFRDTDEVYEYIGAMFQEAVKDQVLGPKFAAADVVLQLRYSEPDATITMDMPNRKVVFGETDLQPTVVLTSKAVMGHRFWLGKLNLPLAMAKGDVKAKGSVPKLLKLVPLATQLFPRYEQRLKDEGREDLLQEA